jgi:hypothetical protein
MTQKKEKLNRLIFIVVFFCFLSVSIFAEDQDDIENFTKFIKKRRVNAAYLIFGGCTVNLDHLNSFLANNNIDTVNDNYINIGVGGHVISNKLVIGMEFIQTITNRLQGTLPFLTSAKIKYSVLNFGYLLHSDNGFMYYPYAGIGIGSLKLSVVQNNIDSFGNITNLQSRNDAKRLCVLTNIGFGVDYFHRFKRDKKGRNNLVIGVRAGYIFSPSAWDWRINRIKVTDGPNSRISGAYIHFTIGLGGLFEKLVQKFL